MSDVKKCDRCGRFYERSTESRFIIEYFSESNIKFTKNGGDMCPKCAERFDRWWNKKKERE